MLKATISKMKSRLGFIKTANLSFIAMACFVIGTLFMFINWQSLPNCKSSGCLAPFHEIEFDEVHIIDSMLTRDLIISKDFSPAFIADSFMIKDTIPNEIRYRKYLATHLPDSAVDEMLVVNQLFINCDTFEVGRLQHFGNAEKTKIDSILWDYYISYSYLYRKPIVPYHIQRKLALNIKSYDKNIEFFSRYPGFALWIIVTIIQFTLFPVLIIVAFQVIKNFNKSLPDGYDPISNNFLIKKIGICLALITVFVVIAKLTFYDLNVITNVFFYKNMNVTICVLFVLGYSLASVCFAGYSIISALPANDGNAGNDISNNADRNEILKKVGELFNTLLIICSIALSIIVLATGVLYSSINSLDFVQKINDDIGFSPAPPNYVLLFSVLNTFLLLLFFIPAKLSLIRLQKEGLKMSPDMIGSKPEKPDFLKGLGDVAIIGSPMFTGLIHFFFSLLAN